MAGSAADNEQQQQQAAAAAQQQLLQQQQQQQQRQLQLAQAAETARLAEANQAEQARIAAERDLQEHPYQATSAPASSQTLERAFAGLLSKHGVIPAIAQHLANIRCVTLVTFANMCDDKKDVKATFLAGTAYADDCAALANLKMAWREAETIISRGLKRSADGLADECLDEPLAVQTYTNIVDVFVHQYAMPAVPPQRVACDTLVGRIHREFEKRQPTAFAISRVRCLAKAQRQSKPKQARVSEFVQIEFSDPFADEEINDATEGGNVVKDFETSLDILAYTWALCGCFDVTHEGRSMKYVTYWQAIDYKKEITGRLWPLCSVFTDASIVGFGVAVEDEIRCHALELARAPYNLPFGLALMESKKAKVHVWQEKRHLLQRLTSSAPRRQPDQPKGKGKGSKDKGKDNGQRNANAQQVDLIASRSKWATASHSASNWKICKGFNDKRGCGKPGAKCQYGNSHSCDVTLKSTGKACDRYDHSRASHDPAKHGAPQLWGR